MHVLTNSRVEKIYSDKQSTELIRINALFTAPLESEPLEIHRNNGAVAGWAVVNSAELARTASYLAGVRNDLYGRRNHAWPIHQPALSSPADCVLYSDCFDAAGQVRGQAGCSPFGYSVPSAPRIVGLHIVQPVPPQTASELSGLASKTRY
jgi:hypothetical protein